jgi:SAM-dependent methyltransferase
MADELSGNLKEVENYYDGHPENEWQRLERHRMEFAITWRALLDYLPPPPARILDCGGGPGRYAIELSKRGYEVTLFDLSTALIDLAHQKAHGLGVELAGFEIGTATDLSRFPKGRFDAVLLMGPLYHLLEAEDRQRALEEAWRVLKPGGKLFATFLMPYSVVRYSAAEDSTWLIEHSDESEAVLSNGHTPLKESKPSAFVAHFSHPSEAAPLCQGAGFEILSILGLEGVISHIEQQVNILTGEVWEKWVDVNYRLATDPSIFGCVEHLLVVAHKPLWRSVVVQLARRLQEAGISYKIAGGASIALHGVPIHVKDLDIEMSGPDAFRFQELFSEYVQDPVRFSEREQYRSYRGIFVLQGVQVDVMGDLQRREGDGWVPTATRTETIIHLEGMPISVSWIEEETLAYIRRRRLDRAALCLPKCDPGRLLDLMRGVIQTDVF